MVGTVSRTARVSVARRNLKEAVSKALARRTEIAYEAGTSGREGNDLQNPITIRRVCLYMRRVYGVKVARITRGDLSSCPGRNSGAGDL